MREAVYTSRETVKAAVDVKDSARASAQIDRLIADASRAADRICHRVFYPWTGTLLFDWPDGQSPTPWRFWLYGRHDLYSITALASGGVTIDPADAILYPGDGPPYDRIEIDQSGAAGFESGATDQGALSITGLWVPELDERAATTIATPGGIDAVALSVDVTDGSALGVGHVARCGDERMLVTEKSALNTGIALAADLGDQMRDTAVALSGTTVHSGEMLLIDGERMLVGDVTGTTAYVTRAADGTPLATHAAGTAVYAYRTLTVERGALGTTAAAHAVGDALLRWVPPAPVEGFTIAHTLTGIAQENSGYARVIGSGDNQREARGAGLAAKQRELRDGYAKYLRQGAI